MRRWSGAVSPPRLASKHDSLPGCPLHYSRAPSGFSSPAFNRYYGTTTTAAPACPLASVSLASGCSSRAPKFRSPPPRNARCRRQDVVEPVASQSGSLFRARCGSLSFPGYPHMPLPCSRTPVSPHALGLRLTRMATYCVHGNAVPPTSNGETTTMMAISGFNDTASALAPYASCVPCGNATQCSLRSGCQPFSGGIDLPTGYR